MAGVHGCGGRLANSGWSTITDVGPNGVLRMQYADGKAEWKRIPPDAGPADLKTAAKNLNVPARYVETRNGGTLTFNEKETIVYLNMPSEKQ